MVRESTLVIIIVVFNFYFLEQSKLKNLSRKIRSRGKREHPAYYYKISSFYVSKQSKLKNWSRKIRSRGKREHPGCYYKILSFFFLKQSKFWNWSRHFGVNIQQNAQMDHNISQNFGKPFSYPDTLIQSTTTWSIQVTRFTERSIPALLSPRIMKYTLGQTEMVSL